MSGGAATLNKGFHYKFKNVLNNKSTRHFTPKETTMSQDDKTKSVAVIGAGSMGAHMARRLLAAGFDVQVCDTSPETLKTFAALGAKTTAAASDCAQAKFVLVMVPTDEALDAVTFGEHGVCSRSDGIKPGIVCVMSTTLPATIDQMVAKAKPLGIELVDAPVSGGPARAEDGTMSIFIGASPAVFKELQPVMAAMGKNLYSCGAPGTGSAVKVINNLIGITNIFITAEAYEIAADRGVDLHQLSQILDASTASNFLTGDMNEASRQYQGWGASAESLCKILVKDISFANALMDSTRVSHSLAKHVLNYAKSDDPYRLERWARIAKLPPKS
jgi:3-hydroxyisobutyrate dehydrogenase